MSMRHLAKLDFCRSRTTGTCVLTLATWTAWEAGEAMEDEAATIVDGESAPEVCSPSTDVVVAGPDMAAAREGGRAAAAARVEGSGS